MADKESVDIRAEFDDSVKNSSTKQVVIGMILIAVFAIVAPMLMEYVGMWWAFAVAILVSVVAVSAYILLDRRPKKLVFNGTSLTAYYGFRTRIIPVENIRGISHRLAAPETDGELGHDPMIFRLYVSVKLSSGEELSFVKTLKDIPCELINAGFEQLNAYAAEQPLAKLCSEINHIILAE